MTSDRPWWAEAPREGFTQLGDAATQASRHTAAAAKVPARFLEE